MTQLPHLIIATRNPHKTQEFSHILRNKFLISDVTSFPDLPEIQETGTTFLENARLKALGISSLIDTFVIADDSGLEVPALNNKPGVYSSSYGGEEGNHAKNNARLLSEMSNITNRQARFLCTLVLAKNGKEIAVFHGSVEGSITSSPSGHQGFGYDPLFIPTGYSQTMAQLGLEIKNQLSHRARAIAAFSNALQSGSLPDLEK